LDGIDTQLDSVFDFALWNTSQLVFTNKLPVRALRDQLKYDALYPDPSRLTTLTNNHDTVRFMSLEGATLEGALLHIAFTLSVRGTPHFMLVKRSAWKGRTILTIAETFLVGFPLIAGMHSLQKVDGPKSNACFNGQNRGSSCVLIIQQFEAVN
jgi:hypothetical protein